MRISANFVLSEFTRSAKARELKIKNVPKKKHIAALVALAKNVLQKARDAFGKRMRITSGYRCGDLCEALGSSRGSRHTFGQAADVKVDGGFYEYLRLAWIVINDTDFDAIIIEHLQIDGLAGWLHISYNNKAREQRGKIVLKRHDSKNYVPLPVGIMSYDEFVKHCEVFFA